MHEPNYWVFDESQLDVVLREWAQDYRHDDPTEEAARQRFSTVVQFLFSRQAIRSGIYQTAKPETEYARRQTP